jgi:integrase
MNIPKHKKPFTPDVLPTKALNSQSPEQKRLLNHATEKQTSQNWVVEYLVARGLHPWLEGDKNLTITQPQANEIITEIASRFSGSPRRHAHNFFIKGLEQGKQLHDWQVELPQKIIQLFTQPPALGEREFQLDKTAGQLRAQFLNRWAQPSSPVKVLPGDIIFSSILFSGILDPEAVLGFIKCCVKRLRYHNGIAWVDWEPDADRDEADAVGSEPDTSRWERVVLDPVTAGLLIRWRLENDEGTSLLEETTFLNAFRALESAFPLKHQGITSIKQFIACARGYWAYESPAAVYYLARRRLRAARLSEKSFYRLITGKREPLGAYVFDSEPQRLTASPAKIPNPAHTGMAVEELAEIRKIIRAIPHKQNARNSNKFIARQLASFCVALPQHSLSWHIQQWSIWILQKGPRKAGALSYPTLREYISTISPSLTAHLRGRSLFEVMGEWPTFIEYLLENAEVVRHKKMIPALASFCAYLHKEHVFPMPDIKRTFAERSVNAVLLTEDEYRLVFISLPPDSMEQVALVLGYRLGLRIGEAAGLEMRELLQHANPTLYVFANEHRTLKSLSSRRILQLGDLCLPSELELVGRYLKKRLRALEDSNVPPMQAPLFPSLNSNTPVDHSTLQRPIHEAIWRVTGCRNISFHGLRHSLVNRALIATMEELYGCRRSILDTKANEGSAPQIDYPLATTNDTRPIRPRLWGIAKQLGHLSPETTIGSYFHLPEWAIFLRADSLCKDIPHTVLAGIAGVTVNNYNVSRARNPSADCMVTFLLLKGDKNLEKRLTPAFPLAEKPSLERVLYSEQPLRLIEDFAPYKAAIESMFESKTARKQREQEEANTGSVIPWTPPAFSFDESQLSPEAQSIFNRIRQFRYCIYIEPHKHRSPIQLGGMTINMKLELPGVPRSAIERLQVNNLAIAVRDLSQADRTKFCFFVAHSLQHLEYMPNAARFTAIDDSLCSWLETLGSLVKSANQGLIQEDEHYIHIEMFHAPATKSDLAEHEQKAAWVHKIGGDCELKRDPSFNFSPKRRIWRNGSLYICIKAPESADSNATNWGRIGSSALYTACYYAALTEPQTLP